jgi:CRP/FNR family transcriptional regulator, cyclic AMP receptor protein
MSEAENQFQHLEALGDAVPFVGRMREIIDAIHLFEDFDAMELETLAGYMRCFRAPLGTEVIAEGQVGDFMVLILNGAVEIVKKNQRGLPERIAAAGPGKTLGEMSLIDGEPRFASCIALGDVEFAVLDRTSLSLLITEHPRVGVKLMMELLMLLNQRLRMVSAQLMECMEARRTRIR